MARPSSNEAVDFLPLTPLSFDVLLALADAPGHGYGILQEIERRGGGPMKSSTGTLYLAIHRLQRDGLLEKRDNDGNSRRHLYALTPLGRQVAAAEAERLLGLVDSARRKDLLSAAQLAAAIDGPIGKAR